MWTTLGHFWVVLHHAVMCLQRVSCDFKSQWKGAHTQWRHTHMHRSQIIYREIPYKCYYLVDDTLHWKVDDIQYSYQKLVHLSHLKFLPLGKFVSDSCGHSHMWLTCLPLEISVLPWWAPEAQSTKTFPGHVIRLGQWVTGLAFKPTHKCIQKPTVSISMNKQKDMSSTKRGRDRQTGSGINHPVLRITHSVCCLEILDTLLSIMRRYIYRPSQKGI